MKKICFLLVLVVFGCTKVNVNQELHYNSFETKGQPVCSMNSAKQYKVSKKDIEKYVKFKKLQMKVGSDISYDISPFIFSGDTLCYVLNTGCSYELVSTDKRKTPVLSYCEKGTFDAGQLPESALFYLRDLSRSYEMDEKIAQTNMMFWEAICNPDAFIEKNSPQTKGPGDDLVLQEGHWELVNSRTESDIRQYGHLIPVHWHQDTPYNEYCPYCYDSEDHILRAKAGCVAIAGAQLQLYLHSFLGKPVTSPGSGMVNGIYPNHQQIFNDESSSTWASMEANFDLAALLIGKTGKKANMLYGVLISEASTWNMMQSYFLEELGISWTFASYVHPSDSSYVINSIKAGSPVLSDATSLTSRHAFIIDGCQEIRTKMTFYYEWVDDGDVDEIHPSAGRRIEVRYFPVNSRYFGMNWGNGEEFDQAWYQPFGSWDVGNNYPYDYNRQIYFNFRSME